MEDMLNRKEEEASETIRKLTRENQLHSDKLSSQEKALHDLQTQIEDLLAQKREELAKLKKEHQMQIQKEQESKKSIEKQFKRVLQEKDVLEGKLKQFFEELDKVEEKMTAKNEEIKKNQEFIVKLQKQIDELKNIIGNRKKQEQQDLQQQENKLKEKDNEIEILKEMIKGIKLQLKSKDTDIQRLMIKIKRLEKTNEIRENVIQENSQINHNNNNIHSHARNANLNKQSKSNNIVLNQNDSKTSLVDEYEQQNQAIHEYQNQQQLVLPPIQQNNPTVQVNSGISQNGKPPFQNMPPKSTEKRNSQKSYNLRAGSGVAANKQVNHSKISINQQQQQLIDQNNNGDRQSNQSIQRELSMNNNNIGLQQQQQIQQKIPSRKHQLIDQAINKNQNDTRLNRDINEVIQINSSSTDNIDTQSNVSAFDPTQNQNNQLNQQNSRAGRKLSNQIIIEPSTKDRRKSLGSYSDDIGGGQNQDYLETGLNDRADDMEYQDDFMPASPDRLNKKLSKQIPQSSQNYILQNDDMLDEEDYHMDEFIQQQKHLMSQLENIL